MTRTALVSHLKTHGIGGSPGTSFRIPDAEIIFYANPDRESMYSGELSQYGSPARSNSDYCDRESGSGPARRLKLLFGFARRKEEYDDCDSVNSLGLRKFKHENRPISYREKYSKCSIPSPSTKTKFSAGLTHGVLRVQSPSSQFSGSSWSSGSDIEDDDKRPSNVVIKNYMRSSTGPWVSRDKSKFHRRQSSLSKILMNQVFCFGAQGLVVDEPVRRSSPRQSYIGSTA